MTFRKHLRLIYFILYFRRSSLLLSHARAPDMRLNESVQALSPVPSARSPHHYYQATPTNYSTFKEPTSIQTLRDCVYDRITFQYNDNTCYRIRLPSLTDNSTIQTCLSSFKQALPRDLAMLLISKWYSTRNGPGCNDLNIEEEWNMFTNLLLEMLGYDLDLLTWGKSTRQNSNTPTPKRKRGGDQGASAWMELNQSKSNLNYSTDLSLLLNLKLADKVSAAGFMFSKFV